LHNGAHPSVKHCENGARFKKRGDDLFFTSKKEIVLKGNENKKKYIQNTKNVDVYDNSLYFADMKDIGSVEIQQKLVALLNQAVEHGRAKGLSQAEVARRAGLPPERLSRVKATGRCEFETFARLVAAGGLELHLVPKDDYATRLAKGLI
jgi:DNA-binding phage protein